MGLRPNIAQLEGSFSGAIIFAHNYYGLMLDHPERRLCSLSVGHGVCVSKRLKVLGDGVSPQGKPRVSLVARGNLFELL